MIEQPTGPNDGSILPMVDLNIDGRIALLHKANAGKAAPKISRGQEIFYASCTMCHAAPNPAAHTRAQWAGITQSMFPRAGLSAADRKLVLEYLDKHAAKA